MTKFLNISTDNTLGGNSPSNETVPSQKAIKEYVDSHGGGGGSVSIDNSTITRNSSLEIQTVAMVNANESSALTPLSLWNGTNTQWEQGQETTWYNWKQKSDWVATSTSFSGNYKSLNYGNGKFVALLYNNNTAIYSTDGVNWSQGVNSVVAGWSDIAYGNGRFVAVSGSTTSAYSDDGINWSQGGNLPSGGSDWQVVYANNEFFAVSYSNGKVCSSSDGTSWSALTTDLTSQYYNDLVYADGKYVVVGNNYIAYSTDGTSWTEVSLTGSWYKIAYGNGIFVTVASGGNKVAYSSDGVNWSYGTDFPVGNMWWIAFGAGKFIAVSNNSINYVLSSTDGYNWEQESLPSTYYCYGVAFGGNIFAIQTAIGYFLSSDRAGTSYYTLESTPTTSSVVYSAPNVSTALTITSISGNTITLSDSKQYDFYQAGNQQSYTNVGSLHPTWLCNINNVGLKIGDVVIADKTSVDNLSITKNSSNELQTVGVINSRDTSTAIKTWTGTKAQYDAIVTKDANTLYNITDDTDVSLTILEALYPVGSIYITTANTCPLSTLISGSTWELVSSGRVLQGADSGHSAGTTIEAGLPNITGSFTASFNSASGTSGAFAKDTTATSSQRYTSSGTNAPATNFDASRSSSIYGNSSTVQPPAYVVNIYRRTA